MQRDAKERKRNQTANYQNSDPPVVFATVLKVVMILGLPGDTKTNR